MSGCANRGTVLSEKRRLVSNTLANGLAQFVAMTTSLVFMPLLIRAFGPQDFGLFLLASAVGAYASLVDFGVGTSLVKNVADRVAAGDRDGIGAYVSTSLVFYIFAGLLVAVVVAAFAVFAGSIFRVTPDGARLLRNLLLVVAVSSLWAWPGSTANYVLAGLQRYTLSASTAIGVAVANIGVILAILWTGQGPVMLLVGQSLIGLAGLVVNGSHVRREIRGVSIGPRHADLGVFRDIISFSWVIFVLQLCTVVLYQQTDRIVLGIFLGATAVTLYEAAGKMQGLVTQLTQFAISAVMPFASQLNAEGRTSSIQTLFFRGSKYVMALILPPVLGLMILARPIILHWLGPAFATQALAAQVLLSYQLLVVGSAIGETILVSRGHAKKRLFNSIAVTVGNLVLSVILVQRIGIMGVVIGTALPWIIDFPWRLRTSLREVEVSLGDWLRRSAGPVYVSLVATAGVALAAYMTPLVDSLIGLTIAMLLAVGAAWLGLVAFSLTPVEKDELRSLARRAQLALRRGR